MTFPTSRPPVIALAFGAVALAALITVVVLLALGLGPFAPGTQPSQSPTAQTPISQPSVAAQGTPSGLATPQPSNTPASSPSGSPAVSLPPATPSSAIDALLAHVPEALRPSCAPASFEQPILAIVSCTADGGAITVTYTLYADQPSMAAVHDAAVIAVGIDDSSGRCYNRNDAGEVAATTSRWPAENGYTIQDEPVGRYLCHDDGTTATLTWTDDRLYILARANSSIAMVDRLISFWIDEAGPIQ
jgi:hypothetical protein